MELRKKTQIECTGNETLVKVLNSYLSGSMFIDAGERLPYTQDNGSIMSAYFLEAENRFNKHYIEIKKDLINGCEYSRITKIKYLPEINRYEVEYVDETNTPEEAQKIIDELENNK